MLEVILGGVTGLLGNVFTSLFKYKHAKLEFDHNEKMVSLETQATIQKAQMQIDITKSKVKGEIEVADSVAFDTSQKVGQEKLFSEKWINILDKSGEGKWTGWFFKLLATLISGAFAFVDFLNTAMRPVLTLYLVASSSYITFLAWKIMEQAGVSSLTTDQAVGIFTQVTNTMIYLSVSAVTWWFGDRTMSKFLQGQGAKNIKHIRIPEKNKKGGGGDVDI